MKRIAGSLLAVLISAAAVLPAAAGTPLHVGYVTLLSLAPAVVADKEGFYENEGLDVTLTAFSNGPSLYKAFASGAIDVAFAGVPPMANWAARGLPLEILANVDEGQFIVMAKNGSGIESLADLKGKRLGSVIPGSGIDVLWRAAVLPKAGLDPNRDVQLIPLTNATMEPAMVTGKIDAMLISEPFATYAKLHGVAHEIGTVNDPALILLAKPGFVNSHKEAVVAFLTAHIKTIRWMKAHPEQSDADVAQAFNIRDVKTQDGAVSGAQIVADAREHNHFTADFSPEDIAWYKEIVADDVKLGYAPRAVDIDALINTTYLAAAKQAVGQ